MADRKLKPPPCDRLDTGGDLFHSTRGRTALARPKTYHDRSSASWTFVEDVTGDTTASSRTATPGMVAVVRPEESKHAPAGRPARAQRSINCADQLMT